MLNRINELKNIFLSQWYPQILTDFKYDSNLDMQSAINLKNKLNNTDIFDRIREILENKEIIVFAPGPSLEGSIKKIKSINKKILKKFIFIAVDGAYNALIKYNLNPKLIVTDLDGIGPKQLMNIIGVYIFLHAHGDNISKIKDYPLSLIPFTIGTCQVDMNAHIHNIGGFTDGDRTICICEIFKVKRVFLAGMDFGKIIGKFSKQEFKRNIQAKEIKLKKMEYAKKIIKKTIENSDIKYYVLFKESELNFIPRISYEAFKKIIDY